MVIGAIDKEFPQRSNDSIQRHNEALIAIEGLCIIIGNLLLISALRQLYWMGGRTAHSVFKLPLNIQNNPDAVCNLKKQSSMATLLKQCEIIIWDDAVAQNNRLRR